MMLEEFLDERGDPRLSVVEHLEGDDRYGSETPGRYLSVDGHLWPEPVAWSTNGTERIRLEAFVDNAIAMVEAWDAGLRTIALMPSDDLDLDPEQGDKDHHVPADLIELHEVLEWQAAVEAEQTK